MPIVTTIRYGREELEKLVLDSGSGVLWEPPAVGRVSGQVVTVRQTGFITREGLAELVQEYAPQAAGQTAEVVALGPKGMRVELTPKPEVKPGADVS